MSNASLRANTLVNELTIHHMAILPKFSWRRTRGTSSLGRPVGKKMEEEEAAVRDFPVLVLIENQRDGGSGTENGFYWSARIHSYCWHYNRHEPNCGLALAQTAPCMATHNGYPRKPGASDVTFHRLCKRRG